MATIDATNEIRLWFDHGLGDCVQFAHLLQLYRRRGFDVKVHYEQNKAPIWVAAGIPYVPIEGATYHPWGYYAAFNHPLDGDTGHGNKAYGNLNIENDPLPHIGESDGIWEELCGINLARKAEISRERQEEVCRFLENLPRPIVLVHSSGTNMQDAKNINDESVSELYRLLLDGMSGSIVLLDWDHRVAKLTHGRVRHIKDDLGHIDLETTLALYGKSDLLIGVDSGPYHLAMFSEIPVLGVFHHHYPGCVALPRGLTANLTRADYRAQNISRRRRWNIIEYSGATPTAEDIAENALRMLAGCRYLTAKCQIARDIQLQQMVRKWCRLPDSVTNYRDRNNSMDWLLMEMKKRFGGYASIVETGCARSGEDWTAGYSTYLFAMIADAEPGVRFLSIDNAENHISTAKSLVANWRGQITFALSDSVARLGTHSESIDVLYLDSHDADLPGHAEHGLAEIIAAEKCLHERSVVVYDDTTWSNGWGGKGALGVPYLLNHGWQIATAGYQTCLVRAQR